MRYPYFSLLLIIAGLAVVFLYRYVRLHDIRITVQKRTHSIDAAAMDDNVARWAAFILQSGLLFSEENPHSADLALIGAALPHLWRGADLRNFAALEEVHRWHAATKTMAARHAVILSTNSSTAVSQCIDLATRLMKNSGQTGPGNAPDQKLLQFANF